MPTSVKYDEIVISKDDLMMQTRLVMEPLNELFSIVDNGCSSATGGQNAAQRIVDITDYFFHSVSHCVESMKADWNQINLAVQQVISFDVFMADRISTGNAHNYWGSPELIGPTAAPVSQVGPQAVWRGQSGLSWQGPSNKMGPNLPDSHNYWAAPEISQNTSRPNPYLYQGVHVTAGYNVSDGHIRITGNAVDKVENVRSALNAMLPCLESASDASRRFVASSYFKGKFAEAVKGYISGVHIPIIEKFYDIADALEYAAKTYVFSYDSLYGSSSFVMDEEEINSMFSDLSRVRNEYVDNINRANSAIGVINRCAQNQFTLDIMYSIIGKYIDEHRTAVGRELDAIRDIESDSDSKFASFSNDIGLVLQYAGLLKKNAGVSILHADINSLKKISGAISLVSDRPASEYLLENSIYSDGAIDTFKRDRLIKYLKNDSKYNSKMENVSVDAVNGMCKYCSFLMARNGEEGQIDSVKTAINRMFADPEWIAKVYVASMNTNNVFLNSSAGFIYSVENLPKSVIDKALQRAKDIALDDEIGYSNGLRWGSGADQYYDCSSLAVAIFEEGADLPINARAENLVTGTMGRLQQYGFQEIDYKSQIADNADLLQPGDILVCDSGHAHAEVYLGDGRTIHATLLNGYDDFDKGDRTGQYLHNIPEHKEELDLIADCLRENYGDFFDENYLDSDGVPVIGEVCAHRITHVDNPSQVVEDVIRHTHWEKVYRYTGGV